MCFKCLTSFGCLIALSSFVAFFKHYLLLIYVCVSNLPNYAFFLYFDNVFYRVADGAINVFYWVANGALFCYFGNAFDWAADSPIVVPLILAVVYSVDFNLILYVFQFRSY